MDIVKFEKAQKIKDSLKLANGLKENLNRAMGDKDAQRVSIQGTISYEVVQWDHQLTFEVMEFIQGKLEKHIRDLTKEFEEL